MGRRQPISNKQRKAQLQEKRAIKRGDLEKPEASGSHVDRRKHIGRSQHQLRLSTQSEDPNIAAASRNAAAKIENSRKLQSAFRKLTPEFLAAWREKASQETLPRPITGSAAHIDGDLVQQPAARELSTPKRPKWRFDMTKKEVERNEEGIFDKWLADTEEKISLWRERTNPQETDRNPEDDLPSNPPKPTNLRSPTYYEQNLEVWRQLWRVTELASILLVLLDSRCPPLHYPSSLHTYLEAQRPARKIILVLTKTDIVGQDRAERWKSWLRQQYPGCKVVGVESYRKEESSSTAGKASRRIKHIPHIPPQYMNDLIDAMQTCHQELLEPPAAIKADPKKLVSWTPRVRSEVDWNVVRMGQSKTAVADAVDESEGSTGKSLGDSTIPDIPGLAEAETGALTIGLIGQPNVGKSSLLNALFGSIKVKASRTPGKTKHFQTLFWSPEIRLVDCPGLVLPNLVPMELQVLASILPISQMASIPSCISFAANLLPLEEVFSLAEVKKEEDAIQDKRTWRADVQRKVAPEAAGKWTAMNILTSYADKKGWVTAKAGRPDINRAGNAILRALAEGKVRWAFLPPLNYTLTTDHPEHTETFPPDVPVIHVETGRGIWIPHLEGHEEDDSDDGSDVSPDDEVQSDEEAENESTDGSGGRHEDDNGDDGSDNGGKAIIGAGVGTRGKGMFSALALLSEDESGNSESDDNNGSD
ncbi:hypothetical protein FRB94_000642 [Tulasnella sp. JGI-2019a]|nr:hypothetical protein FRB93_011981 [Tulasnella sp. JGI-2019a]KAG9006548.1 hypothetical protein FRB94_000642 [Tulasnella sp. JGI-2019a]